MTHPPTDRIPNSLRVLILFKADVKIFRQKGTQEVQNQLERREGW